MRSDFICISIAIVVSSVFSQRPFARNLENLKRAVPHHFNNDKENADGGLDKIARGHKIEPRQPPLRPHQEVPWLRWVHEGRWAAQADKNSELHKVRARLLEEKLKPNQLVFKPHINPQLKPKLKQKENARTKREVIKPEVQKETEIKGNVRRKRDLMMPQLVPEMIMQPHIEAKMAPPVDQNPPKELNFHFYNPNIYYPEALEALANQSHPFKGRVKDSEKREKRQILYFINRPPQYLARSPRTTPNPFIRDTHIDDYDIIRPEVGEREGMIPTVESGSSDLASDPLVDQEATEFSKIISQFYIATSDEFWLDIQRFADSIFKPLSEVNVVKTEINKAVRSIKDMQSAKEVADQTNSFVQRLETFSVNEDLDRINKRVKRRVNKTLKRKRAKKKKERLRRFERKRLRMLTHARRVRRQQKSKQARLQRHYARMNMSTTITPEHHGNQTLIGKVEDITDETKSKDSEESEITDEEDEEYESSEYEDESEDSDTKTEETSDDTHEKSGDSEKTDEKASKSDSKPDYGEDDYEDYEDESEDDYSDDSNSKENSDKKKNKIVKGKNIQAAMKNGGNKLNMMIGYKKGRGNHQRTSTNNKNRFSKENPLLFNRNTRLHRHQKQSPPL